MNGITELNSEAYQWLMKNPLSMWSRHPFEARAKSDHITNNISESFNQWITNIRHMFILTLLDQLRVKLMERMYNMYEKGCGYDIQGIMTTNVKKKLDMVQQKATEYIFCPSSPNAFKVTDMFQDRMLVNLIDHTCTCRVWNCTGLPCKHVAAAITFMREKLERYCDSLYSIKTFMDVYGGMIHPFLDLVELTPNDPTKLVQPLVLKRRLGRPHKIMNEEGDEEYNGRSTQMRCRKCKQVGHNKRIYQLAPMKGTEASTSKGVDVKVYNLYAFVDI
ncbi:uncharacterized protein LOC122659122 [Telopea speciosissima]|uniref:uncharacterized protein LOC122659122 n=1 Tax=Telopea speciosissima TaxID=54955 RepID=UPI001CC6D4F4|nr:uncharacterized protein LOC122659122 [Telopea speciosissima]